MSILETTPRSDYFSEYKRLRYCESCKEFNYHEFVVKYPKILFKCDECNQISIKFGND